jgi:hypothetical protein
MGSRIARTNTRIIKAITMRFAVEIRMNPQ